MSPPNGGFLLNWWYNCAMTERNDGRRPPGRYESFEGRKVRLTAIIHGNSYQALSDTADLLGTTRTDVINHALVNEEAIQKELVLGNRFLVADSRGEIICELKFASYGRGTEQRSDKGNSDLPPNVIPFKPHDK